MSRLSILVLLVLGSATAAPAADRSTILDPKLHHVRNGTPREWAEFPEEAEAEKLIVAFKAKANQEPATLVLRQQDVKQVWKVLLNHQPLGELVRDENDLLQHLPVPPGTLVTGENVVRIECTGKAVDDIRVGQLRLEHRPAEQWLAGAQVDVTVRDEAGKPLPCRLTITDAQGALHPVLITPAPDLAVRAGTIYTATGRATFQVPAGKYTLYAGRGFEYSLAKSEVQLAPGHRAVQNVVLHRQVPTPGYVACDTHLHTLTHSGHGDATLAERMVTIAGEGIELPVAADHNKHIDYEPAAEAAGVRQSFTPVIGNEVTTSVGHFNIFPVRAGDAVADHRVKTWPEVFAQIGRSPSARIIILNHARDLHSGVRPFGPQRHNAVVAENLQGWPIGFNAMEVINSGATQTDPLQLFRDWTMLLNRGYAITPVGSSDSHDVSRHFAGQGRTYIRCDDRDAGNIDVAEAVQAFAEGRVLVSYGLLAELTVAQQYGPGDLATLAGESVEAKIRVLGPSWVQAERVQLYANGALVREAKIDQQPGAAGGLKWQQTWTLPKPKHDVHWTVVALGAGVAGPYWKTAKPYQPTSPVWQSQTFACTGAVYLDADGDGRRTSVRDYAERVLAASRGDLPRLIDLLGDYDAATAAHAAYLAHHAEPPITPEQLLAASRQAPDAVKTGIANYVQAWRNTEIAQAAER